MPGQISDFPSYAELIQNRAFQGSSALASTLHPWTAVGDASIALENTTNPLSSALPTSIQVNATADGVVGIKNPGWWGIDVRAANIYNGSFYSLGTYVGNFTASLVSDITNQTLASVTFSSSSVANNWTQHTFELQPSADAANSNNSFLLTYSASSGDVLNFNLISLFPPTYKGRVNGNRKDLSEALAGLNAKFFRIPGGNNIEGASPGLQWNWTKTLGPLTDRPGRYGDWGYENTDGLGLVEYILWSEELGVEPLLAVFAGYWLDHKAASEDELQQYIDSTLNELEFLLGNTSTTWGAQRAALGYPDPFSIKFVEIGNEDHLSTTGIDTYKSYRLKDFYDAIKAKYPDLLLFSSNTEYVYKSSGQDYHEYTLPNYFVGQFGYFDNFADSAGHPIVVGEFAAVQNNTDDTSDTTNWSDAKFLWPYWIGSVAEAVFLLGAERNADRVWGVSYAPLLQNLNSYRWTPDLISFTANTSQTVLSTSYEVIKLLGNNAFTSTLPATTSDDFGPAYWVAGVDNATETYYVKAAVYNSTEDVDFTVAFAGLSSGGTATLTVLTAPDGFSHNEIGTDVVTTNVTTLTASGNGTFSFSLPNLSVAVLAATA
ncbi:hypothetical protein SLS53_005205 [Cytospora paraplurivora]|uniref:non-reducing end alpha-L-arabinofuranosidase n=1 Tax=Cytospora paraplurivora TaxID=2898453 RepID=A0AAN9YGD1_9PEZI